jgi:ribosomal protein L32E
LELSTKSKYKRRYSKKYKMKKLPNWRKIPGHVMDTRKLMNGRNKL